ncbi:MAG TPA: hypothetical protein V6C58_13795 [Allocoleopsis sp.]
MSREEFANMERMLLEYKQGYEGIYSICYQLAAKIDQLDKQITELIKKDSWVSKLDDE